MVLVGGIGVPRGEISVAPVEIWGLTVGTSAESAEIWGLTAGKDIPAWAPKFGKIAESAEI